MFCQITIGHHSIHFPPGLNFSPRQLFTHSDSGTNTSLQKHIIATHHIYFTRLSDAVSQTSRKSWVTIDFRPKTHTEMRKKECKVNLRLI